jgi:hypothetical protein
MIIRIYYDFFVLHLADAKVLSFSQLFEHRV